MSPRRTVVGRLVLLLVLALVGVAAPSTASAAPATGTLTGHVVDDLGRPVPGASVQVDATLAPFPEGPYGPVSTVRYTKTDAFGRYSAPDIPARDDYVLRVDADGYQGAQSHPDDNRRLTRTFSVGAGQTVTEDLAMIELSVTIRGRVVDFSGAPIAGASTTFGDTDASGTFEGRAIPGDTRLSAAADGFLPTHESAWEPPISVRADRGQTVDGVVIRLRRVPTQDCWGEDGSWTPAGGHRDTSDADGNRTQVVAATPPTFPYAEHLCPDTDDAPYRDIVDTPVRVGVPKPPLPKPAAAKPAATKATAAVGTGTLRAAGRVRTTKGAFAVSARCTAACGGRVVATTRRAATRGRRATDVVLASATVATGTGTRTVRLTLTAAGRRAVAASRSGVVATLRWTAPGTSGATSTGPRVRVLAAR